MNLNYKKRIVICLAASFFIFICFYLRLRTDKSLAEVFFIKNNFSIHAEMATTQEEQRTGLMYREKMEKDRGMLFVFEDEVERNFWMKNTEIPLDIIFISKEQEIVDIKESFEPCSTVICPTYKSIAPAYYVLEVNAGLTKEKDLKIGDKLRIVME